MRFKVVCIAFAAGVVAAVVALVLWEIKASPHGQPSSATAFQSERFKPVPVSESRSSLTDKLKPRRRKSRAEELLEGLPAGTEAYEVKTDGADAVVLYRSPEGGVFTPRGEDAVVAAYRKTPRWVSWEVRPAALVTTDLSSVAGGVSVGVLRVGRVHAGPAAAYGSDRRLSVGGAATCDVWRNVGVGVYVGKAVGGEGWVRGVSASLSAY